MTSKQIREAIARSRLIIERYKPPPASGPRESRQGEQRELALEDGCIRKDNLIK
jgi:hypothetical protein